MRPVTELSTNLYLHRCCHQLAPFVDLLSSARSIFSGLDNVLYFKGDEEAETKRKFSVRTDSWLFYSVYAPRSLAGRDECSAEHKAILQTLFFFHHRG